MYLQNLQFIDNFLYNFAHNLVAMLALNPAHNRTKTQRSPPDQTKALAGSSKKRTENCILEDTWTWQVKWKNFALFSSLLSKINSCLRNFHSISFAVNLA